MPYIKNSRRPINSTEFDSVKLETKGDLTAAIFDLQLRFIDKHELNYQNISDSIAAASDAADEIKRRIRDPYEEGCIVANGDFDTVKKIRTKIVKKFYGKLVGE